MSALLFALLVPEPAGSSRSAGRDRLADGIAVGAALGYGALMVRLGDATAPGAAVPWPVDVAIGALCAPKLAEVAELFAASNPVNRPASIPTRPWRRSTHRAAAGVAGTRGLPRHPRRGLPN